MSGENLQPCRESNLSQLAWENMASGICRSSVCGATLIKQEPVETEPLASPEQEIEHISVKQETPVDVNPLASPKQEMEYVSAKEETPEWDVPDDHNSMHDPQSITKEECSSSEDFLSPSAPSIEDDDEEDEDAMSEDDFQTVSMKHYPANTKKKLKFLKQSLNEAGTITWKQLSWQV
ncbi:uncharacterized protein LOC126291704 isoform X10 [Schistocerca gregaria]|uniref:uncharacterized protein LOC126291704 isoform X10 n=1 Tax=Schistocerca gregaria TaxID=7010 RepID=UPI00211E6AA3|nr:uncharacterized protein LOC126291704 isoform X10 [Schistocerca gregaria]